MSKNMVPNSSGSTNHDILQRQTLFGAQINNACRDSHGHGGNHQGVETLDMPPMSANQTLRLHTIQPQALILKPMKPNSVPTDSFQTLRLCCHGSFLFLEL